MTGKSVTQVVGAASDAPDVARRLVAAACASQKFAQCYKIGERPLRFHELVLYYLCSVGEG